MVLRTNLQPLSEKRNQTFTIIAEESQEKKTGHAENGGRNFGWIRCHTIVRGLSAEVKLAVLNHYNSDDVSRMMPEKADFVRIRDKNGNELNKQHKQNNVI